MYKENIEAGDRVVFGRCKKNKGMVDITIGRIYNVVPSPFNEYGDLGTVGIIDDGGDYSDWPLDPDSVFKPTKIID